MKYRMWLLFLLAACTALSPSVSAEEKEQFINSGRPGFNETLGIIPTGRVQQEMGYVFIRDGSTREHELGQLVLRLGTGNRTELQLGANSFAFTRSSGENTSGVQDSSIGFKVLLAEGGEQFQLFKPAVALVAGSSIPTGARADRESSWQPQAKLSLGWTFSERLSLSTTMISTLASHEGRWFMQKAAGVSPSYSLTQRWACYAEAFAYVPNDFSTTRGWFCRKRPNLPCGQRTPTRSKRRTALGRQRDQLFPGGGGGKAVVTNSSCVAELRLNQGETEKHHVEERQADAEEDDGPVEQAGLRHGRGRHADRTPDGIQPVGRHVQGTSGWSRCEGSHLSTSSASSTQLLPSAPN